MAASALSLALVAGAMPANVGGRWTGGRAIVAGAYEASETITFSEKGYGNATSVESVAAQDCTITFAKGTNNSNDTL